MQGDKGKGRVRGLKEGVRGMQRVQGRRGAGVYWAH